MCPLNRLYPTVYCPTSTCDNPTIMRRPVNKTALAPI